MAALKKKADDDDAPKPDLTPIKPFGDVDPQAVKLRKGNLLGVVTWELAIEKLQLNLKYDFAELAATVHKMFGNVLANPEEQKFRKIRHSNPNFVAKVWSMKGGPEIFEVSGWKKDTIEAGFLVLPEGADLALLQRALDALTAQTEERAASEEKKRKLDAEAAKKGREARAQKAAEEANVSAFDATVASASSMVVDEDEAMVEAIEEYVRGHPELCSDVPGGFDHFEIEGQVAGLGGTIIASVAASKGTKYYDLEAHMKRSEGGQWTVSKVKVGA